MKQFLTPFVVFLSLAAACFAQELVKVDKVDFDTTTDDWVQMEIELSCDNNSSPNARDKDFVEDIKVKVYLGYERDVAAREYDYYTSEVEIIIMEKGEDNNVYFYLPGPIVKRDQLKEEPKYYYVEVSVDGKVQKAQKTAFSSDITSLDILKSFTSAADSKGKDNENILMPIYFVAGQYIGRVDNLPAFLRRDARK